MWFPRRLSPTIPPNIRHGLLREGLCQRTRLTCDFSPVDSSDIATLLRAHAIPFLAVEWSIESSLIPATLKTIKRKTSSQIPAFTILRTFNFQPQYPHISDISTFGREAPLRTMSLDCAPLALPAFVIAVRCVHFANLVTAQNPQTSCTSEPRTHCATPCIVPVRESRAKSAPRLCSYLQHQDSQHRNILRPSTEISGNSDVLRIFMFAQPEGGSTPSPLITYMTSYY